MPLNPSSSLTVQGDVLYSVKEFFKRLKISTAGKLLAMLDVIPPPSSRVRSGILFEYYAASAVQAVVDEHAKQESAALQEAATLRLDLKVKSERIGDLERMIQGVTIHRWVCIHEKESWWARKLMNLRGIHLPIVSSFSAVDMRPLGMFVSIDTTVAKLFGTVVYRHTAPWCVSIPVVDGEFDINRFMRSSNLMAAVDSAIVVHHSRGGDLKAPWDDDSEETSLDFEVIDG